MAIVYLVATPSGGYRLKTDVIRSGTFSNANNASTFFTMPNKATIVTANFEWIGTGGAVAPRPQSPGAKWKEKFIDNTH